MKPSLIWKILGYQPGLSIHRGRSPCSPVFIQSTPHGIVLQDSSVELVYYCCPAVCNYQDQKIKCKVNSKKSRHPMTSHPTCCCTGDPWPQRELPYSVKAVSKDWESRLCARCTMHHFVFFLFLMPGNWPSRSLPVSTKALGYYLSARRHFPSGPTQPTLDRSPACQEQEKWKKKNKSQE